VLVDWCQRFLTLEHGIDVPHCQLFKSHMAAKVSNLDLGKIDILTFPEYLQHCAL
jgi:hypothetical protein